MREENIAFSGMLIIIFVLVYFAVGPWVADLADIESHIIYKTGTVIGFAVDETTTVMLEDGSTTNLYQYYPVKTELFIKIEYVELPLGYINGKPEPSDPGSVYVVPNEECQ